MTLQATDDVIGYLDTNLETLHARLSATIYPNMIQELWGVVLGIFDATMLSGVRGYFPHTFCL